jgi:hypothetical protein
MARQTFASGAVLTAAQMNTLQASVWSDDVNAQTGTSYTLVLTDAGKQVTLTNASAIALTVPANSTVAYAIGVRIMLLNLGAGVVTVGGAGGVTVSAAGNTVTLIQYQSAVLIKTGTDTWLLDRGDGAGGAVAGDDDQIVIGVQVFS